jgi:hypothetical protein
MATTSFSNLLDQLMANPVRAERLIAAVAEVDRVYTEMLHPEDDEPGYVGRHRRE